MNPPQYKIIPQKRLYLHVTEWYKKRKYATSNN